jgi:hypothetical protein
MLIWILSLPMTTLREFTMLHIMNSITDKPGWEKKVCLQSRVPFAKLTNFIQVFDDSIAEKWKSEALSMPGRDVTQKMVDWVIEELRYKANIFKDTLAVSVLNGDVVKSDTVISEVTKKSLQAAVKVLEDVPEIYKDYHPGSDGKVLDLVHPSLFPLIYGRTRALTDSLIGLSDCIESCGKGSIVSIRSEEETALDEKGTTSHRSGNHSREELPPYSKKFQVSGLSFQLVPNRCLIHQIVASERT